MSAFPATIPVKLDDAGRIAVDLHCPACGYNLRTQRLARLVGGEGNRTAEGTGEAGNAETTRAPGHEGNGEATANPGERGRCPECGAGLDLSRREEADRLDRADTAWRARIRRGARWLHASVWAAVLVLPGLIGAAGALWLLTTREPGRAEGWMARGTRLSARWASVASAAAAVVLLVLLLRRWDDLRAIGFSVTTLLAQDWRELDVVICLAAAAMAVALLEAWRHLFALAARADGPAVAQLCRQTWKRYLIVVGVVVAIAAGTYLAEPLGLRLPSPYFEWTAVALTAVVAAVLGWVWWVTLGLTRQLARVLG